MADKAIHFLGDDYVSITYSTDFDFGSGDFTIELWYYLDNDDGTILGWNDATSYAPVWLYLGSDGNLYTFLGTTTPEWVYNVHAISEGAWTHYVLSRISGVATVYFNADPHTDFSASTDFALYAPGTALRIARAGEYGTPLYGTNAVDELRIYKGRGLTQGEVNTNYASDAGKYGTIPDTGLVAGYHFDDDLLDYSGNGHHGAIVGDEVYVAGKVIKPAGWGHKFMGVSNPTKVYGSTYAKVYGV